MVHNEFRPQPIFLTKLASFAWFENEKKKTLSLNFLMQQALVSQFLMVPESTR